MASIRPSISSVFSTNSKFSIFLLTFSGNTVLYTTFAFAGTFSTDKLIMTIISSYVIFVVTSFLDTPFVYLARWMYGKGKIQKIDEA